MPTTKPKLDLKAADQHHRRLFCPDGGRIEWPGPGTDRDLSVDRSDREGLCAHGDYWSMRQVGYGKGARRQLRNEGKAGWTQSGHLQLERVYWYAQVAHSVGTKVNVSFNCSHGHFPSVNRMIIGRDEAQRQTEARYPEVVRALRLPGTDDSTMEKVVRHLTELGWDFVTDNRIRCSDCIKEESELAAKLAELARLDAGGIVITEPPGAGETVPKGWDETATGQTDAVSAAKPGDLRRMDSPIERWETFDGVAWREIPRPYADPKSMVSYEYDQDWGLYRAEYEGTHVASIEQTKDGTRDLTVVSYGRGMGRTRSFANMEQAKAWIEQQAGDLADLEVADEL